MSEMAFLPGHPERNALRDEKGYGLFSVVLDSTPGPFLYCFF